MLGGKNPQTSVQNLQSRWLENAFVMFQCDWTEDVLELL